MRSTEELRNHGIASTIGHNLKIGEQVGHPSHRFSMLLLDIDDGIAVCECRHEGEKRFPAAECFDPNKALAVARATQHAERERHLGVRLIPLRPAKS